MLGPRLLAHRASNVEGSLEMLTLTPSALLARRYVAASHPRLPPPATLGPLGALVTLGVARRGRGAAAAAAGHPRREAAIARPAARRRPSRISCLSRADALLLGGSIFDLLTREEGDAPA